MGGGKNKRGGQFFHEEKKARKINEVCEKKNGTGARQQKKRDNNWEK